MSRYTIEMNFAKAKGQAKELDNAAARLERIASGSMEDAMEYHFRKLERGKRGKLSA